MVVHGYVDPDFPNPNGPNDASIIIYGYRPSIVLAIIGIILFTIATIVHLFVLIRKRSWYFTTMTVATVMEIVGYIFRLLSSQQDPYSVPWFVVQYFFIVVAPVFISAAIYTTVSVLINLHGPGYAPLPPKGILAIFITCDVVATIVQVAGAALVGVACSNQKDPTVYNHILLAGLAFQVFSFALFLAVLGWTLWKARRSVASVSKIFLTVLVVATLAVYLRTCFRLAETAEGLMHSLSTHEVYFGCLEFAPIVVAVCLLAVWHPGVYLGTSVIRHTPDSTKDS